VNDSLVKSFEESRPRLRSVAHRMLGSTVEAEDAVQEAWLHATRADASGIANLGGWLTTIVSRICLDMLRARRSRREAKDELPDVIDPSGSPDREALVADSVGAALLVVLDTLAPPERIAFVLHDLFDVPFEEIAPIVGRTPTATRQLASRARRRVEGGAAAADVLERAVVEAFRQASREGDLAGLLAILAPDVVVLPDAAAARLGAVELRGDAAVAAAYKGRAREARPVTIDGAAGTSWAPGGKPRVVFAFTIEAGRIVEIQLVAELAALAAIDLMFAD